MARRTSTTSATTTAGASTAQRRRQIARRCVPVSTRPWCQTWPRPRRTIAQPVTSRRAVTTSPFGAALLALAAVHVLGLLGLALVRRPQRGVLALAVLVPFDGLLLLVPHPPVLDGWKEAVVLATVAAALVAPPTGPRPRPRGARPGGSRPAGHGLGARRGRDTGSARLEDQLLLPAAAPGPAALPSVGARARRSGGAADGHRGRDRRRRPGAAGRGGGDAGRARLRVRHDDPHRRRSAPLLLDLQPALPLRALRDGRAGWGSAAWAERRRR